MTLVAAALAALALWLAWGPARSRRLVVHPPDPSPLRAGRLVPAAAVATVIAAVVVGAVLGGMAGATVGFALALPALTLAAMVRRQRRRALAVANAEEVAGACQLVVGLLRVGHVPSRALRVAARDAPVLAEAAAMLEIGGTIPPVLRVLARGPGRSGLAELAAAWEVSDRTGASLTSTLEALAERLEARRGLENVVAAELSASRATGRLLAVLPVAGIALGYAFGGDPLGFLTGSWPGRFSLLAGVVLGCAGVFWTELIADREGG